jgi:hypothetical protein
MAKKKPRLNLGQPQGKNSSPGASRTHCASLTAARLTADGWPWGKTPVLVRM